MVKRSKQRGVNAARGGLVCAAVCWVLCAGCATTTSRDFGAAGVYPENVTRAGVVDVQVVRDGTKMSAVNTSGESFGASRVWVNRRYAKTISGWNLGDKMSLDLREFRDEFGESFRAGGFFAAKKPDPVVLVEIETGDEGAKRMVGLVVVKGDAE